MSELAWKLSPKFSRRGNRPMLATVPDGFKGFLEEKIKLIPSENKKERDVMVRQVLALWHLCWYNVPDGWQLIDERLRDVMGENWQEDFEERNGKIEHVQATS